MYFSCENGRSMVDVEASSYKAAPNTLNSHLAVAKYMSPVLLRIIGRVSEAFQSEWSTTCPKRRCSLSAAIAGF